MRKRQLTNLQKRAIARLKAKGILGNKEADNYVVIKNRRMLLTKRGIEEIVKALKGVKVTKQLAQIIAQREKIEESVEKLHNLKSQVQKDNEEFAKTKRGTEKWEILYERLRGNRGILRRLVRELQMENIELNVIVKEVGKYKKGEFNVSIYEHDRSSRKIDREVEKEIGLGEYMSRKKLTLAEKQSFLMVEGILRRILKENANVFGKMGYFLDEIKVGGKVYDMFADLIIKRIKETNKDLDGKKLAQDIKRTIFEIRKEGYLEERKSEPNEKAVERSVRQVKPEKVGERKGEKKTKPAVKKVEETKNQTWRERWVDKKSDYNANIKEILELINSEKVNIEENKERLKRVREIIRNDPIKINKVKYILIAFQNFPEVQDILKKFVYSDAKYELRREFQKEKKWTISQINSLMKGHDNKIRAKVEGIIVEKDFAWLVERHVRHSNEETVLKYLRAIPEIWKKN